MGGSPSVFAEDVLKTVERYDPERNVWEAVADMKTERVWCAAAVLEGKLVCDGWYGR